MSNTPNEPADPNTPAPRPGEQTEPAMDTHPTDDTARLAGIVEQTRADVGHKDAEAIEQVLRERMGQVGVTAPDAEVRSIAEKLATGG
ncbi:hypothetical protein M4I32_04570 [Microbacterium sp. LRZ72]|uniref:hypothetical protein n=1 Tax=Microbacterium sp. LRZ72 TaxID=2942481 RepID=UPI0029ABD8DD|nr:hypothetical protein [Microbacterium sp. LRZ72]MDX2376071.1 hypothetical protein [Microbacterium sp. LRZ72]